MCQNSVGSEMLSAGPGGDAPGSGPRCAAGPGVTALRAARDAPGPAGATPGAARPARRRGRPRAGDPGHAGRRRAGDPPGHPPGRPAGHRPDRDVSAGRGSGAAVGAGRGSGRGLLDPSRAAGAQSTDPRRAPLGAGAQRRGAGDPGWGSQRDRRRRGAALPRTVLTDPAEQSEHTFPATDPRRRIDAILTTPGMQVRAAGTVTSTRRVDAERLAGASDHLPTLLDVTV